MGQVIDELCTTIKIIVGFSATADEFDAIGLLKLIQKAILNVQSQQYFPASVHLVKKGFYYRGQEKGSTVQEYYENFKNNMEVMKQLGISLGGDNGMVDHILTGSGQ